ncbi:MAG: OmpA family protein [Treponema sp.]|jgi:hypothetical protein|nr:OmpA family protein [Treponema sp.]
MKRIGTLFLVLLLALVAFIGMAACKSPPPPPPPPVETPPPPPPPPPPPEPEPESDLPRDTDGPELSVMFSTRFFSPDGDGIDDELQVTIFVTDESPIKDWKIEIREPQPPYLLFSEWSGEGMPPEMITWGGRSASGELVQSASEYPFKLTVSDILGNTSVYDGLIEVDILVIREPGEILRVMVPSIVFGANAGGFEGLDGETMADNDRILRRIADVLSKFDTYQVKVEGHSNPTTAPGTRARSNEETGTRREKGLLPLSEERAKTVVNYLVNLGVPRERLTAVGMGSSRTIIDFADKDHWWKNRRVEFILVK